MHRSSSMTNRTLSLPASAAASRGAMDRASASAKAKPQRVGSMAGLAESASGRLSAAGAGVSIATQRPLPQPPGERVRYFERGPYARPRAKQAERHGLLRPDVQPVSAG